VDQHYSKAYLRHLFKSKEMLGSQIGSIHNLAFYLWLVEEARNQIKIGSFSSWKREMTEKLARRL
jgi:queuine tRNA-ribosyltransferase